MSVLSLCRLFLEKMQPEVMTNSTKPFAKRPWLETKMTPSTQQKRINYSLKANVMDRLGLL